MKKRKAPTNAETRLVTAKGLLGHTLYYGKTRLFFTVIAVVSLFPGAIAGGHRIVWDEFRELDGSSSIRRMPLI